MENHAGFDDDRRPIEWIFSQEYCHASEQEVSHVLSWGILTWISDSFGDLANEKYEK